MFSIYDRVFMVLKVVSDNWPPIRAAEYSREELCCYWSSSEWRVFATWLASTAQCSPDTTDKSELCQQLIVK